MAVPNPAVVAAERLCTRLTTRLLDGDGVAHVHAYRDAAPTMQAVAHARVDDALLLAVPRIDRFGGGALARAAGSGGLHVRVQLTLESDQREFRIRLADVYALGTARLADDSAARDRARRVGSNLAMAVGHGGCAVLEVQIDAVVLHGPVGGRHYRLHDLSAQHDLPALPGLQGLPERPGLPEREGRADSAERAESAESSGPSRRGRSVGVAWPGQPWQPKERG